MYPSTYVARRTLGMWHLQVGPIMYASTSRFFFSREAARHAAPDATPAFAFFALRSFAGRAATVVGKGGGTPPRARMNTGASATRTSFGRRGEAVAHGAADCVAGEVRSIDWTFVGGTGEVRSTTGDGGGVMRSIGAFVGCPFGPVFSCFALALSLSISAFVPNRAPLPRLRVLPALALAALALAAVRRRTNEHRKRLKAFKKPSRVWKGTQKSVPCRHYVGTL